jgi:uncharacterized protein (DUF952 family)
MVRARIIYKICPAQAWDEARGTGRFAGHGDDLACGFIHFSTADQVEATASKHFAGLDGLILVAVAAGRLGAALKWETSRGGALFPHLYGPLSLEAVLWTRPLPLGAGGAHVVPEMNP